MSYENFAYYYDSLMEPQFYDDYHAFIYKHCQFNEVLELGCGTGDYQKMVNTFLHLIYH